MHSALTQQIWIDADEADAASASGIDESSLASQALDMKASGGAAITAKYSGAQSLLAVTGDNTANAITIGRDAAGTLLVNGGAVTISGPTATVANTNTIQVSGSGGDDTLTVDNSGGALPLVTISGGSGNDTIIGGTGADDLSGDAGNDTINGGDGNDTIAGGGGDDLVNGGRGNDTANLGAGDDTFVWNPGDASDVVDGDGGTDTLVFNGANIDEKIDISATAGRVAFTRNIGTVAMNLGGIETIAFTARGGADTIAVHDLSETDAARVNLDLAGIAGSGAGDALADVVAIDGSAGTDAVVVKTVGAETVVSGLKAEIHVAGADAALDQLSIALGAGNDSIDATGLAANGMVLTIDGGTGNDSITGSAGNDTLLGGEGNDFVAAGAGNDSASLGDGNDTFAWTVGDGSDVIEGDAGIDTFRANGSSGDDSIFIGPNGTRVLVSAGSETVDAGGAERIAVSGGAGDDTITAMNGLGALAQLTIDGGAGNDTIIGGDGDDVLAGGDGNDSIFGGLGNDAIAGGDGNDSVNGGRGNDTASLGAGDDTFVWNPGDGSDTIDGDSGSDKMQFNGANIGEKIDISANAGRVAFTRDIASITMNLGGVETIAFTALSGADSIAVHDLSGTDTTRINLDLSGIPGTGVGDTLADSVSLEGSASAETVTVTTTGGETVVAGLHAEAHVAGADAGLDTLRIATGAGNDAIDASGLAASAMLLTIDAGAGADSVKMSAGDDTFVWHVGDGSDIVDGGAGSDTVTFAGGEADETIGLAAVGAHVALTRDIGNVSLDLTAIERIDIGAGAGADTIAVGDLSGTGVGSVNIDLGTTSGGDGVQDNVTVEGSAAGDTLAVLQSGTDITILGPEQVQLTHVDGIDTLHVDGGAGNDTLNAAALLATSATLTLDGGAGDDTIIGGHGADQLLGGAGNDVVTGGQGADMAQLGAGDDTFVWNPGDGSDTVDGGVGSDTLVFNGANIAETIDLSAVGGHLSFTRNIGTVAMDVSAVEAVTFEARGGVDLVNVHDLTGTGVGKVVVDLEGAPGTGDGSNDIVTVEGTNGNDAIVVSMQNGHLVVDGLASQIVIDHFEAGDTLQILGLGGDDVISAANLPAGITLVLNGGNGADLLIGGDGNDTLLGGEGDDILIGGLGLDTLDGGPGANVVLQDAAPVAQGTDVYAGVGHALIVG